MQVFLLHLMQHAYLDMSDQQKYRTGRIVLPNTCFDPVRGHELYNRHLDELEQSAELGTLQSLADAALNP
jgi:hypothetical protein